MGSQSENAQNRISRRSSLAKMAAGISAAVISRSASAVSPAEQLTVGLIGAGSRGFNLLDSFLVQADCRVVAVCDVDELHYRDRPWGSKGPVYGRTAAQRRIAQAYAKSRSGTAAGGIQVTADYREITGRDDVDIVIVATPDHWHALCTIDAIKAGKDVYCEKPLTHLFHEGQQVVKTVAEHKAIFQTGSQQRSDSRFRRAAELARNGVLGNVQRVEVGLPPGYDKPQGATDILPVPDHLDYNFWCGPSPVLPYMQARHHRWWRGHRAYGGGVLMDWIGHHNDIAHWAIGAERSGPTSVEAVDWVFPDTDVYDTPQDYTIACEYADGITSTISSRNREGLKIIGSEGWVWVTRGRMEASDQRWIESGFDPGSLRLYRSDDHTRNFLDGVRNRTECVAPAEIGHRSVTPGHLAYVASRLKQKLQWNAADETFPGNDEANQLLQAMSYRSPWVL